MQPEALHWITAATHLVLLTRLLLPRGPPQYLRLGQVLVSAGPTDLFGSSLLPPADSQKSSPGRYFRTHLIWNSLRSPLTVKVATSEIG